MEWLFEVGEILELENADGMKMVCRILHRTTVEGCKIYLVQLDTGLVTTYSEDYLNEQCAISY